MSQIALFSTAQDGAIRVGHLLVKPIAGVPGRPWGVHSSAPHSAWIELYRSRDEAQADAADMLARGAR